MKSICVILCAVIFYTPFIMAQQISINFSTSYAEEAGELKSFNGVHGGPININNYDPDLSAHYQNAGVNFVRFPYGDGFNDEFKLSAPDGTIINRTLSKLTLGDIFPDKNADPLAENSYQFSDFDKYVRAIKKIGAEPVWQAIFDIGQYSNKWLDNGRQAGKAPSDMIRWNYVVTNVLRHVNNGWARGMRWDLKYVEFSYDPSGLGGYDFRFEDRNVRPERIEDPKPGRLQFINDFIEFIKNIEKYNQAYKGKVKALGPGLDAEQTIRYLPEIMNRLAAQKIKPDSFIFTYRDFNSPQRIYENAVFIRAEIDRLALGAYRGMPLWNVEWNWPHNLPIPIANKKGISPNEISAWLMTHNLQVKTLVQPYWDQAIMYRATRPAANVMNPNPPDLYYFNLREKGTVLPAYVGWLAMNKVAKETPVRLNVKGWTKDCPITVLAAKSRDNRRLNLIVSYWKESEENTPISLRYAIDVANFSPKEGYKGKLYVLGKNSKTLELTKPVVGTRGSENGILISEEISLWTAHLLEFER